MRCPERCASNRCCQSSNADTGIGWQQLPQQLGYGSGMTCWCRLRDWQTAGVWDRPHQLLLAELRATSRLDLARAIVDSSHCRGPAVR